MADELVTVYEIVPGGIGNSVEMSMSKAVKACLDKTHWSGFSGGVIPEEWSKGSGKKSVNNVAAAEENK